jgi:hypothetical protein
VTLYGRKEGKAMDVYLLVRQGWNKMMMIVICYAASAMLGAIYNHFMFSVEQLNFMKLSIWAQNDNFMLGVLFTSLYWVLLFV